MENTSSPATAARSGDGVESPMYVPFGEERRPLRPTNTQAIRKRGAAAAGCAAEERAPRAAQPSGPTREDRFLAKLRAESAERYAAGTHEWMLRELWDRARCGGAFEAVSPCWRTIGFQQDDPTPDMRGCGALGLRQLLHFCQRGGGNSVRSRLD